MESLIATVVLSVAVVGISGTLVASSQQAQDVDDSTVLNSLASALMEEVASKPFAVPPSGDRAGWSGSNRDRFTYDNILDFNGYTDTSPFTSLAGRSVDPNPAYRYTRIVSVLKRTTPSDEAASSGGKTGKTTTTASASAITLDFAMTSVRVTSSSGNSVTLNRLVCNTDITR